LYDRTLQEEYGVFTELHVLQVTRWEIIIVASGFGSLFAVVPGVVTLSGVSAKTDVVGGQFGPQG